MNKLGLFVDDFDHADVKQNREPEDGALFA